MIFLNSVGNNHFKLELRVVYTKKVLWFCFRKTVLSETVDPQRGNVVLLGYLFKGSYSEMTSPTPPALPADSWPVTLLCIPLLDLPLRSLSFELHRDSSNDSPCLYCRCHSSCLCVCYPRGCVYICALKLVHVWPVMTAAVYNASPWQGSFGPTSLSSAVRCHLRPPGRWCDL